MKLNFGFKKNYTLAIFKRPLWKDSEYHNNALSAIRKVGHRSYFSAMMAFLADIYHVAMVT